MLVKVYINKTFKSELDTNIVPRIGELVKFLKDQYRVVDVQWRMKANGLELLHARLYLQ